MIAKKLAPTWFCDSIYDINPDVLLKNNIKTIFFDLDNTLIPYY